MVIDDFKSEGCTCWVSKAWAKLNKATPPWEIECIKHDIHYWMGGSFNDRRTADMLLYEGVRRTGHPVLGILIYVTMRLKGCSNWGFGHSQDKRFKHYFDRHHDAFVLMQQECENLQLNSCDLFGGKIYD